MISGLTTFADDAVRWAGTSAARAGAAGAAGGVLLDDIPVLGPALDPTEGGGNGGSSLDMLLLGALLVLLLIVMTGGAD